MPDADSINSILNPFINPWYTSLENPQRAQEQVLADLMQKYGATDYGANHGATKSKASLIIRLLFP